MPPKTGRPNGFYVYMKYERNRLKNEGKEVPNMQDMAIICAESWKTLNAAEKSRYQDMARLEKYQYEPERNTRRMDNQRQIIADRRNPVDEEHRRRSQEIQDMLKSWEGQDLLDVKFFMINFQVMYEEDNETCYLPMEIGMVCFTLRKGVISHFHEFINPGDAPQGDRHLAFKHSEEYHQIPLFFERATDNFYELWKKIEKFVVDDPHKEVPAIYCMRDSRRCMEGCLDYIHYRANIKAPFIFTNVYTLEDLVKSLIIQAGKSDQKPSEGQIKDALLRNQWDYLSTIRCQYHDEVDCVHCSLAIVRRLSFSLFDMMSNTLGFKLTANHMPDETCTTSFTVMQPTNTTAKRGTGRPTRGNLQSGSRVASTVPSPSASVTSVSTIASVLEPDSWGVPRVNKVVAQISDSESDDEVLYTDEVRSTSERYSLKELRKPKAPAMVLPSTMSNMVAAFGRGVNLVGTRAASSTSVGSQVKADSMSNPEHGWSQGHHSADNDFAYLGRGGRGMPVYAFASGQTTPGYASVATSVTSVLEEDEEGFTPVSSRRQSALMRTGNFAAHNIGGSASRGRGMPPQMRC